MKLLRTIFANVFTSCLQRAQFILYDWWYSRIYLVPTKQLKCLIDQSSSGLAFIIWLYVSIHFKWLSLCPWWVLKESQSNWINQSSIHQLGKKYLMCKVDICYDNNIGKDEPFILLKASFTIVSVFAIRRPFCRVIHSS